MDKKRDIYIDILRCTGIILVILAHVLKNNIIGNIIYYFHMPFFFLLSGMSMCFSYKEEITFKEYFTKKVKGILIPYFIFAIVTFIYWAVFEKKIRNQSDISTISNFINIFLGFTSTDGYAFYIVMWFLPCMFATDIIFYFVKKSDKFSNIILIILFLIGYILVQNKIFMPFGIETAMISILFLYFGYVLKKKEINVLDNRLVSIIIALISILGIFICYRFDCQLNMLNHIYPNIILFFIGTLSGIYITMFVCSFYKFINKRMIDILSFFGQNTLIIMCCHEPIKRIVIKLFSIISHISEEMLRSNIIFALLITVIILLVTVPIIYIINKYFPFIIGKKCKVRLIKDELKDS